MRIKIYALAFSFAIVTLSVSCKKDPGPGGTSTIQGKVFAHHITKAGVLDTSYYDIDDRIYIIYGDNGDSYDNSSRTSFDGSYKFQYLQKGTYKIYCYSVDTTGLSNFSFVSTRPLIPKFASVDITSNGQTVNVPDITVYLYD